MLNRLHDIREISNRFLADVVDVTTAVRPDPQRASNFMEGHAEIVTPFNRYRLSTYSPHGLQPPGAPSECASLGSVLFNDPATDVTILGARSDRTLLDISRHVHHRELHDAIALARRELAEAGPDAVKPAQSKLSDLVSRAAKYGLTVDAVPMAPPTKTAALPAVASTAPPAPMAAAPAVVSSPVAPAMPADEPMIGLPITFICNPGEGAAGMTTVPGVVTRVWHNGQIGLQMFVDDHEIQHRPKVHRRGTDAGGGRVHQTGCWAPAPWHEALVSENRQLSERISVLADKLDAVIAENEKLVERVATLEAASTKPRRGRPAKPEGSETEGADLVSDAEASTSGQPAGELELTGPAQ
jgi:hypothetical protein